MIVSDAQTLVVHTGGIGDLLLSCPAIALLAADGPIDLLGRPDRGALLQAAGLVGQVHNIETAGFESVFGRPNVRLRAVLAPYRRVVAWMSDPDGAITRGLHACGVESALCFHGLPPAAWPKHASAYYLHCIGAEPEPAPAALAITPAAAEADVVIHPGSGSPRKNWPLERFEDLAARLIERGRRVRWCIGPAEEENGLAAGKDALRCDSLVELAAALAAARLYIGNDSGVTHLAAAVGCPTVALFGPTDPAVWAPLGAHVSVLIETKGWPTVAAALEAAMAIRGNS